MRNDPHKRDGLALAGALPDRGLMLMVAAMTFLAALALAGGLGVRSLASIWASGAANLVTVQVPDPDQPAASSAAGSKRGDAVLAALATTPGIERLHRFDPTELQKLLAPWLGSSGTYALPLPAVIELHLSGVASPADDFTTRLQQLAPGTLVERNQNWSDRLEVLASSLLACAVVVLAVVGGVASSMVAMATRLGLGARREAILILHGLGAADGYIAGRFSNRTASLAFAGGVLGTLLALLPLFYLTRMAMPFSGQAEAAMVPPLASTLPVPLLSGLALLPLIMAVIGWIMAQIMARLWLHRLP